MRTVESDTLPSLNTPRLTRRKVSYAEILTLLGMTRAGYRSSSTVTNLKRSPIVIVNSHALELILRSHSILRRGGPGSHVAPRIPFCRRSLSIFRRETRYSTARARLDPALGRGRRAIAGDRLRRSSHSEGVHHPVPFYSSSGGGLTAYY